MRHQQNEASCLVSGLSNHIKESLLVSGSKGVDPPEVEYLNPTTAGCTSDNLKEIPSMKKAAGSAFTI